MLGWAQGNPIGKPSTTELLEIDANFQRNDAARIDWADVLPGAPGVVHPGANPLTRSIWVVDGNSGSSSTKLEKEVFRGSSNKNGDNIASGSSPYAIETSSPSAPQKNDLTNIYAHTRRIGADQWLMFGAETRSTDGASYLDFEYNQAGIAATATQLTGNGLHSGRTVGDLLIIVNYENGGSAPAVETRRWEATNKPNQPYDWSEPVAIPSNSTNLFVVANGAAVPPAAPNTAFTGDGATANVTASLQLVEGSVNLTALGLLPPSTCDRGATMLVKTRTSPSYTSELKDFSLFDFSLTAPGLPTANGAEYCVGSQASALTASGLPGATLLWYTDATGGTGAATAPVPSTTTAGTSTYYVSQVLNGCEGARLPVQVVVREAAGAAAGPDQMVCSTTTSVLLSGSVSGSATSGTWSGGHGSFADANALNTTYTFAAADIEAGSVTLTLTTNDPAGPCGAVADQVVITINRAAVADAGKDQEVCASALPVTLAGQVSGGANSGTWSGGTGMFANASALNTTYSPSAAEIQAGTVTLTLTSNDPDGPCDAVADNVTIRILPAVSTQAGPDQTVCASVPVALQGSVSGGATTGVWTSSGTGTFSPSATSLTATYTPSAADVLAGSVKLTLTSADPTGPCPSTTDDLVVTIQGCATKHCTLTQGGYGNAMGKICSGPIRLDLLNNTLLTTPLKVGAGANTLTYVSGQGQCLIDKLPAGGTAGAMNAGALTGCSIPSGMLKNGKFNNVLLGQTLALALNLRLDPTLGAVRLPATGVFTTYAASSCTATAPTVNLLDVKTATIPASVRTYLGSNANVDSILSLANKAIGGLYKPATGKPSYADINQAVSGINEVFDNCRMQLDASAPSASLTQTSSTMQSALRTAPGTPVLYPNPTTQDATLEFSVGQPQPYSLEVYDMQGRRVEKTVYGLTEASGTQSVTFGRSLPEGVYLVRLITTGATTTLRLVKRP